MALGTRSLKKGELVIILGAMYRNRETGTLVLQRDDASKFLYAQDGQLIFAASNASEDKFTEILVQKGKLTADQLAIAMEKKEGRTIGRTLVEMGFLASSDLLEALIDQMRKIAASTANWGTGRAVFKAGVLPQNLAKLPVSTPRFIIDMALAVEDREWTAAELGHLEEPLTVSQAEKDVLSGLSLSEQESKIVEQVDGKRNAREICEKAGSDLFTGARFLIGLSQLGLVHLKQVMAPTPPSKHAREKVELDFLDEASANNPPDLPTESGPAAPDAPTETPRGFPFVQPSEEGAEPPQQAEQGQEEQPPAEGASKTKPAKGSLFPDLIFPEDDEKGKAEESPETESAEEAAHGGSGSKRWLYLVGIAVVVLACAGAAYWYFFLRGKPYVPVEKTPPMHTRMTAKNTQPATARSPAENGAAKPQATAPSQTTPPPAAPEPSPPAPAAQRKAAARVAPTPSQSAPPSGSEQGARALLREGRYKEAALAFQAALGNMKGRFAIDVEVACQPETIQKGFAESGGDHRYMILPYDLHGRACFRVMWGLYKDKASAEEALKSMPSFFLQNSNPRVAPRPR